MLHRAQVINALILAFIIYFATQIYQEFIQLSEEVTIYQIPLEEEYKINPKLKLENSKIRKNAKKNKNSNNKKIQQVENERDLFKKLLWESNLRNILAGIDEFSPLLTALPRVYAQDDPELIEIIKEKYLIHPLLKKAKKITSATTAYNIQATQDTSMGQAQTIRRILNEKTNGFFIECGALDGETRSNTLFLEKDQNWNGILIEADPLSLAQIRSKSRHRSWIIPACLSTKPETMFVTFAAFGHVGHIVEQFEKVQDGFVNATCLPLYSILLALDNPIVDYFSLDIEGNELEVLKTIPFDKVDIKTLSVEYFHLDEKGASNDEMKRFMLSQGYQFHSKITAPRNHANDYIFVKNDLL